MTHLDTTKVVREALKAVGVKARCRKLTICGDRVIQVFHHEHNGTYSADERAAIVKIALDQGFTYVRGLKIDPEIEAQLINKNMWEFRLA